LATPVAQALMIWPEPVQRLPAQRQLRVGCRADAALVVLVARREAGFEGLEDRDPQFAEEGVDAAVGVAVGVGAEELDRSGRRLADRRAVVDGVDAGIDLVVVERPESQLGAVIAPLAAQRPGHLAARQGQSGLAVEHQVGDQ
jgi:hypothetical protein